MLSNLRTKVTLGLVFLFLLTLAISMEGVYQIYKLNGDAKLIMHQNLQSIVFSNNMLLAMESSPVRLDDLEKNLRLQQLNITEPGEDTVTANAAALAKALQQQPNNQQLITQLRQSILQLSAINQKAVIHKNERLSINSDKVILGLSVITLILLGVSIIFIFAYPPMVEKPIQVLMQQIKTDKTRIEAIINQMKDAVVGYDMDNNILFMNDVMLRLCAAQQKTKEEMLIALMNLPTQQRITLPGAEGYGIFIKEKVSITTEGDPMGYVIVLRDISALEAFALAKTRFIASASHELKTPISSMQMSISLLQDSRTGTLQPNQQDLLDSIREDVDRILKISSDLLGITEEKITSIPPSHSA
ncbi:phospho-acceptor domain-containing protein [Chitinophaga dinghuensis]|uniref:histidine kinase n=1 Tax=Chitinophaga dinghuensis TaxID=1539050 RepID=A0A327VKA3_9BACT|nr:histidine kinase dimerization/phospho-acceptor domain-containing protein [Chitinophaga dinghuensis]RAJ73747.1 phospho-acceptor domain-containing protein [Chitinophaga dinghuensis]